jgi:hypothetical protein
MMSAGAETHMHIELGIWDDPQAPPPPVSGTQQLLVHSVLAVQLSAQKVPYGEPNATQPPLLCWKSQQSPFLLQL